MGKLDDILRNTADVEDKRKDFSCATKIDTMIDQNFCCKECHRGFTKKVRPHFDHIQGSSNNHISNCQALCPNCHNNKSVNENREIAERDRQRRESSNIDKDTKWI